MGLNVQAGQIQLGTAPTALARLSYDYNQGDVYLDNSYDNAAGDIVFRTRTAGTVVSAVTITGGGNVGIGTTTPSAKLSVVNNVATGYLDNYSKYQMLLYDGGTAPLSYGLGIKGSTVVFNSAAGGYSFAAGGSVTRMMLEPGTGYVGIGTAAPDYLLHVGSASASGIVLKIQNSSGYCTMNPITTTWSCTSDLRLNKDVVDTEQAALPWLADMRIRDFTMKADNTRHTGVIAQEMLATHRDMVHENVDGLYTVDAPNPWKLVKAMQDLKAANDNLVSRTTLLEAQLKAANDNDVARDAAIDELRRELKSLKVTR